MIEAKTIIHRNAKKMISYYDYNKASLSDLPTRILIDLKAIFKKNGLTIDEGAKAIFEAIYEKSSLYDKDGYPKYKLIRKI